MKKVLEQAKDFKIIPENFKSSGELKILEIDENVIKAEVLIGTKQNMEDYRENTNVEVFGVNDSGLLYFEAKIKEKNGNIITLKTQNKDYSIIQRRECSRVDMKEGKIKFSDLAENVVLKVKDISAGGLRFISRYEFNMEKRYNIELMLPNNMNIKCKFQPTRITKLEDNRCMISGKFVELENLDRVVLVQYAFKIQMEQQNKEELL